MNVFEQHEEDTQRLYTQALENVARAHNLTVVELLTMIRPTR